MLLPSSAHHLCPSIGDIAVGVLPFLQVPACGPTGRHALACALQGTDIDTEWPSYLDQFTAWLAAAFPKAQPRLVNKAQSGSTSNIFDACAEAMVPKVGVHVGGGAGRRWCRAAAVLGALFTHHSPLSKPCRMPTWLLWSLL